LHLYEFHFLFGWFLAKEAEEEGKSFSSSSNLLYIRPRFTFVKEKKRSNWKGLFSKCFPRTQVCRSSKINLNKFSISIYLSWLFLFLKWQSFLPDSFNKICSQRVWIRNYWCKQENLLFFISVYNLTIQKGISISELYHILQYFMIGIIIFERKMQKI